MQGNSFGFSSERRAERKIPRRSSTDSGQDIVEVEIDTTDENRVVCTRKCMIYTTITILLISCGIGLGVWYVVINN